MSIKLHLRPPFSASPLVGKVPRDSSRLHPRVPLSTFSTTDIKVEDKKVQHKKKKKAIYPPLRLLSIAPKSTAIAPFYNSKIKVFAKKIKEDKNTPLRVLFIDPKSSAIQLFYKTETKV